MQTQRYKKSLVKMVEEKILYLLDNVYNNTMELNKLQRLSQIDNSTPTTTKRRFYRAMMNLESQVVKYRDIYRADARVKMVKLRVDK